MKNKYFYIGMYFFLFLCSCITLKKNKVTRVYHEPLDYKTLADSIKSEVANNHGDYIYYQSDDFKSAFIIYKDSVEYYHKLEDKTFLKREYRTLLYKINREGIYLYHSSFWRSLAYNDLSKTFETILNDSIYVSKTGTWYIIEHASGFQLECKSGENIISRSGANYLLRQEQPLGLLISRIERDILRAEQDWQHWKKIRGQIKCIN